MNKKILILFLCLFQLQVYAQYTQLGSKLIGSGAIGNAYQGVRVHISDDGNTALIGGSYDNNNQGAVWVYTNIGNNFIQVGNKLVGSGAIGNSFQSIVTLSEDKKVAIIGGHGDNSNQGAIWVFTFNGTGYVQSGNKLICNDGIGNSNFGYSLSISADSKTILVGGSMDNSQKGAAWIFTFDGINYVQYGNKLVGSGAIGNSRQGISVSLSADGKTALIGGYLDNSGKGATWIFTFDGINYVPYENKLVCSDGVSDANFGSSVSLSADAKTVLITGYSFNFNEGATWIFTFDGINYNQAGNKLIGTGTIGQSLQGTSSCLSKDGKIALVGGYIDNSTIGATWVFTFNGSNFVQAGNKLVGTGIVGQSGQGISVSLSANGKIALIGGAVDNNQTGATWVFVLPSAQTITGFNPIGAQLLSSGGYTISGVTATSVLPVTFTSSNLTIATITGNAIRFLAQGVTTITAFQPGNSTYAAADPVMQVLTITNSPIIPTINFTGFVITVGNSVNLAGLFSSNSAGAVTFISSEGSKAVVVSGSTLVALSPGLITITGIQATAGNYSSGSKNITVSIIPSGPPGQFTQLGNKLVGTGASGPAGQGFSVSISADGKTAFVGGPYENLDIGAIWAYTFNGNNFVQYGSKLLLTTIGGFSQGFSTSLSADGKTALIGSASNHQQESAWICTFNGTNYVQFGNMLTCTGGVGPWNLTTKVSLSADGKTLLLGSDQDSVGVGAVWVFTFNGSNYVQLSNKLTGTDVVGFPAQGYSMSLSADGKTALIGGPADNLDVGAVWVYTFNGTGYVQVGNKLVATGFIGGANQGYSVSLSADGKTALVGGYLDNSGVGASWIYTFNGSNYVQFASKLVGTGGIGASNQGYSVSLSSDATTALISGVSDNNNIGATWIFTFNGTNYVQAGNKLVGTQAIGTYVNQGMSTAISADGKTALFGTSIDNSAQGAAWIFKSFLSQSIIGFNPTGTTLSTYTISGVTATSGLPVIFTSSNPSVATISGDVIFFLSPGVTTITAFQPGNATYAAADPIPKKLTLGAITPTINFSGFVTTVGNSVNLANLFSSDSPGNVSFSSSEGSKAVVASGSTLVALTPGVVTITGTQAPAGIYLGGSKDIVINIGTQKPLGNFTQLGGKNVGTNAIGTASQGSSVMISGDGKTALVGGDTDNSNIGAVWVYTLNGSNFVQVGNKLAGSDAIGPASQGRSVGISADGKTIIIGGPNDNASNGAAWIYTFNGTDFIQLGNKLVGSGNVGVAAQGSSVYISADGKTAFIGGEGDNSTMGAAWVFTYNGSNFVQFGNKLTGIGSTTYSYFGLSLSLSANGKTALISGNDQINEGAAWVFTLNGSNYTQVGNKFVGNDVAGIAFFGQEVSLSADGNTALIGGFADNSYQGAAWIFTFNGTNYIQLGNKLVGMGNEGGEAFFGASVSLSADGKTALVGGPMDNSQLGATWLFTFNGTNFDQAGNKLIGSGYTNLEVNQGSDVSLSADGRSAIIGGRIDNTYTGASWFFVNTTTSCNIPQIIAATASPTGYYSVSVSGTGPFTYKWYRNGTLTTTTTTSNNFNLLNIYSEAHYFCIISNTCGADTSANLIISVGCIAINNLPITGLSTVSQCATNSYSISDVGGRNYIWSTNSGIISDPSSPAISVYWTTTGTYLLTMTASNECSTVTSFSNISVIPNSNITSTTLAKPLIGRNNNNLIVNNSLSGVSYQWIYNGTEEEGQTTSTHTIALKQGAYQVKALQTDCQLTFSDVKNILPMIQSVTITNIELNCVTSVESLQGSNIEVYPNPGSGLFNLIAENIAIGRIEVFNAQGKTVYNNIFDKIIDMGDNPSGIYLLKIYNELGDVLKNFRLIIE